LTLPRHSQFRNLPRAVLGGSYGPNIKRHRSSCLIAMVRHYVSSRPHVRLVAGVWKAQFSRPPRSGAPCQQLGPGASAEHGGSSRAREPSARGDCNKSDG
jgi:hypothetical protein